jgi:hypothetical protein
MVSRYNWRSNLSLVCLVVTLLACNLPLAVWQPTPAAVIPSPTPTQQPTATASTELHSTPTPTTANTPTNVPTAPVLETVAYQHPSGVFKAVIPAYWQIGDFENGSTATSPTQDAKWVVRFVRVERALTVTALQHFAAATLQVLQASGGQPVFDSIADGTVIRATQRWQNAVGVTVQAETFVWQVDLVVMHVTYQWQIWPDNRWGRLTALYEQTQVYPELAQYWPAYNETYPYQARAYPATFAAPLGWQVLWDVTQGIEQLRSPSEDAVIVLRVLPKQDDLGAALITALTEMTGQPLVITDQSVQPDGAVRFMASSDPESETTVARFQAEAFLLEQTNGYELFALLERSEQTEAPVLAEMWSIAVAAWQPFP